MQKKYIALIFVVFVVTGCGKFSSNKSPISDVNVRTGTSGLEIEWLKESPPAEIYENQVFEVNLLLKNEGASDITDGLLVLGFEEDYMELMYDRFGQKIDINLKGKSMQTPVGEEKIESFVLKSKEIDKQTQEHESSIYVTSCYKYRTEMSESVCIDPDFYNIKKIDKACQVKDLSLNSQGAPVAISKIEERISSSENGEVVIPQFTIYIDNKGKGNVIDKSKIDDVCSSATLSNEDINKLKVQVYLSGIPLECKPYELKLRKKQDKVICTLKEGVKASEPAFTTLLSVVLDYGYTQTISKNVKIKKNI